MTNELTKLPADPPKLPADRHFIRAEVNLARAHVNLLRADGSTVPAEPRTVPALGIRASTTLNKAVIFDGGWMVATRANGRDLIFGRDGVVRPYHRRRSGSGTRREGLLR